MASKKPIKRYAIDLLSDLRRDMEIVKDSTLPAIDLAEVLSVKPSIVVEPHHANAEYDEDYLLFKVDPASLRVGDLVVLGRTPSHQPIVLGTVDYLNEDPFLSPDLQQLKDSFEYLRENTQHWRTSVTNPASLPLSGNDNGDLRFSLADNIIYRWDAAANSWVSVTSASGDYLPLTGGTLSGDVTVDSGASMVLVDPPVDGTDAVNKDYVDSLSFGAGVYPVTNISSVDSPYSLVSGDRVILVDCTLSSITINLPSVHSTGTVYDIKDKVGLCNINNITIVPASGDTVDGDSNYILNTNYEAAQVISDGSNWYLL